MKHLFLFLVMLISSISFSQNSETNKEVTSEEVPKNNIVTSPYFEGGTSALIQFLSDNLHFNEADMDGLERAKVNVGFVVEKNGEITNVYVKSGVNEALDKEAVRVIKSMPYWIPSTQNGNRVRKKLALPINFAMN